MLESNTEEEGRCVLVRVRVRRLLDPTTQVGGLPICVAGVAPSRSRAGRGGGSPRRTRPALRASAPGFKVHQLGCGIQVWGVGFEVWNLGFSG